MDAVRWMLNILSLPISRPSMVIWTASSLIRLRRAISSEAAAIDALGLVVGDGGRLGVETLASLNLFRVGLSDEDQPQWTKFTYSTSCDETCTKQEDSCGCLEREAVSVGP